MIRIPVAVKSRSRKQLRQTTALAPDIAEFYLTGRQLRALLPMTWERRLSAPDRTEDGH
jgi:hypothetical protein